MNHIVIRDWQYSCGEPGCCDEYGTDVIINGGEPIEFGWNDIDAAKLGHVLDALGVEYEIRHDDDDSL
jgi:hypothetical protein